MSQLGNHSVSITVPFTVEGANLLQSFTDSVKSRVDGAMDAPEAKASSTTTNSGAVAAKAKKKKVAEPEPKHEDDDLDLGETEEADDDFLGTDEDESDEPETNEDEPEEKPKAKKGASSKAEPAKKAKAEKGPTLDELLKVFKSLVDKLQGNREPALAILKKFKVKSVRDIDETDYPRVLEAIKAATPKK